MRASWNHVPSQSYVSFMAERLRACSVLILRVSEQVLLDVSLIIVVDRCLSEFKKLTSESLVTRASAIA